MPWKNSTSDERRNALIGRKPFVKSLYKESYGVGEKKFMEEVCSQKKYSAFFKEIDNSDPSDWLLNHKESGQTFEEFWDSITMSADTSIQSTIMFNTTNQNRSLHKRAKNIYILPLGAFPDYVQSNKRKGARRSDNKENGNPFFRWLRAYCEAFFYSASVKVLPAISIEEVQCKFRVNTFTGRYQLNASDILTYLRKIRPRDAHCLVAVTMVDLYPRESWNFVFGLASTTKGGSGGVGVFSFSRYDEKFYESWTLDGDKMAYLPNGNPDYSVFNKTPNSTDGTTPEIDSVLLYRACKVMTHEVGHMFGLKHCVWMQCLMNGSNHLQESDRRPSYLCPICLRKLQSVLQFSILDRYQSLRSWMSGRRSSLQPRAKKIELPPKKAGMTPASTSTTSAEAFMKSTIASKRRENKPWVPKHTFRQGKETSRLPQRKHRTHRSSTAPPGAQPPLLHNETCSNETPPLEAFQAQKSWLDDAIEFIASSGKPGTLSKRKIK